MTSEKDFKRRVRERAARTGESYAAARRQLVDAREDGAELIGLRFAHQQLVEGPVDGWWEGFRPVLDGLDDDEYLWKPVAGAATIRRRMDRPVRDLGSTLSPSPIATIGWLITGMDQLLRMRTDAHFGERRLTWLELATPDAAEPGLASLDESYATWTTRVRGAAPQTLARASEGPPRMIDGQFPFLQVILHTAELLQVAGGQILLLRKLYEQRSHRAARTD